MWIYVPSFCYGEKRGFLYYVRLREKTNEHEVRLHGMRIGLQIVKVLARNNLCGRICVIYILFGRKYIRRK